MIKHSMKSGQSGFTIVELLIVIVVIAVLASVTVVAFNGVRDRTKVNSMTSNLSQIDRRLRAHYVDNGEQFPSNLSDIGVNNTSSHAYTYNRATGGRGYCLADVSDGLTYSITSSTRPTAGACAVASTDIVPTGGSSPPTETVAMAFDGNLGSKWLVFNRMMGVTFSVVTPINPSSYVITSGNDYSSRDPLNWTFEGSNDRFGWVVLDSRTNQTFSARNFSRTFTASGTEAYEHFKLNITQNSGAGETQLSEIQIPGATVRQ